MQLMAFTDEQLGQLRAAAEPIPWNRRRAFLERVAELLASRPIGNGAVLWAAQRAQVELLGVTVPEE
jgi:hypothetical protein